jgi:putative peptide zinc metalloprotease protein
MKQRMMNLLFPRIPLWDPDVFIKGWMPVIRVMISWLGAFIWLAVVGAACVMLAPHWETLFGQTANLFQNIDPNSAWLLWVTFIVIKFIHEMGHAFSCRRFGGEVHEVGIMFLVLVPTPYVDASSAWAFPNKWKRIFVGAGGMIFELFVAAIAAFVWLGTMGSPGLVNQLAYNTMLIASVSTILFNANPLLRYDGYYILSDYWEIPNLQRKSSEYTLGLIKRHLFRVKQQHPLPTPLQRVQLFVYAVTSSCYRIFISLAIAYMLFYLLPQEVRIVGLLMGVGSLVMFLCVPMFKGLKYLSTDAELHRKRGRAWAYTGATAALVVVAIGVVNYPVTVRAEGIIEAADRSKVYIETPGFVESIKVNDGDWVEAGQIIMVLANRQEATELARQQDELALTELQIRESMATDPAAYQVYLERKKRLTTIYDQQKDRVDRLIIRAPISGTIVAPELKNLPGAYLPPSQEVAQIAQAGELEAFVLIENSERQRLDAAGTYTAELRVVGDIDTTVPVNNNNITILPAAKREVRNASMTHMGGGAQAPDQSDPSRPATATPQFEARIRFANNNPDTGNEYYPGQRVYVRFKTADPEPLAVQWYRWFRQLTMNTQQS